MNPALQLAHLEQVLLECEGYVRRNRLVCRGVVQPLPICERYRVRIDYRPGHRPKVRVEDPPIWVPGRPNPPHTYAPDEPCLFYPGDRSWLPDLMIAYTIIPWLLEWLVYYEAWLVTGQWQGGGVPHPE